MKMITLILINLILCEIKIENKIYYNEGEFLNNNSTNLTSLYDKNNLNKKVKSLKKIINRIKKLSYEIFVEKNKKIENKNKPYIILKDWLIKLYQMIKYIKNKYISNIVSFGYEKDIINLNKLKRVNENFINQIEENDSNLKKSLDLLFNKIYEFGNKIYFYYSKLNILNKEELKKEILFNIKLINKEFKLMNKEKDKLKFIINYQRSNYYYITQCLLIYLFLFN